VDDDSVEFIARLEMERKEGQLVDRFLCGKKNRLEMERKKRGQQAINAFAISALGN
jgi:hypothetical protein